MRVFLTGATGFIGTHIIPELQAAGHQVLGLARSDEGARKLAAAGVEAHRGTQEAPDSLRAGAARADAVIHTAFDHDFAHFQEVCEKDRQVILALGEALKGTDRPILITSGTAMGDAHDGQSAIEDVVDLDNPNPRVASEKAALQLLDAGIDVRVMRLPQVHDETRQGLVSPFIEISREKGVVAYVGEGANRWPAASVLDVAKCYQLALDKGLKGARYHAVAEEGIPVRAIAEVVGAGLRLPVVSQNPEEAQQHFGWLAMFAALDAPASSRWTREQLNWEPTGPGLIADLQAMDFARSSVTA